MEEYFRGRKIYWYRKYPSVRWPEHPLSHVDGAVAIHRIVAYEKYGDIPDDMYVHHIDEDKTNWDEDNLILVSSHVHRRLHTGTVPKTYVCGHPKCTTVVVARKKKRQKKDMVFCSLSCATSVNNSKRYDIDWPPVEEVQRMVDELGYSATGKRIGCSDNAVKKFLERNT